MAGGDVQVLHRPELVAKVTDVIGLYLAPPENAIVLCVDEKSQIQALDRTAPMLPMQPGLPARRTHDYVRHGTSTLFAALDIATGTVTGACKPRHRHQEFLAFLKQVARAYPDRELHLVMDNYATHKRVEVRGWLAGNPRIHVHFTPTSGSWLNLVEVWFGIIERQAIHRGSFTSVKDLNAKIRAFVDGWNDRCHPFVWTKPADQVLKKANRQTTRGSGLGLGEVEAAAGHFGQFGGFLEGVAAEPAHGGVHVLDADVEQGRAGVVQVTVGRPVGDAVPGSVGGVQVVLFLPALEVVGLDADHDVLHDGLLLGRAVERTAAPYHNYVISQIVADANISGCT